MLVNGVLAPFTEPAGVELDGEASPSPLAMLAFFFAAFSARRFCLEAEGAMMRVERDRWSNLPPKISIRSVGLQIISDVSVQKRKSCSPFLAQWTIKPGALASGRLYLALIHTRQLRGFMQIRHILTLVSPLGSNDVKSRLRMSREIRGLILDSPPQSLVSTVTYIVRNQIEVHLALQSLFIDASLPLLETNNSTISYRIHPTARQLHG